MTGPEHRRADSRFRAALPARLHGPGGVRHDCTAEDLSRGGVLLVGDLPTPEEPRVRLTVTTPADDLQLEIGGRVVHIGKSASGAVRIGVAFDDLDPDQAAGIENLVSRVMEGMAPAAIELLPNGASVEDIRAALDRVPVAHRIQLAGRADYKHREMLRYDTDPDVLDALARNPHLSTPEVIHLLRRPDLKPKTLEVLASDARWLALEEVRVMIATHPRVTFQTADRIALRMDPLALDRLIRRPGLQPGLKQKLMAKLAKKHRGA